MFGESIIGGKECRDRPAGRIFDEPEIFRFVRFEDLQVIEAAVASRPLLQDSQACNDGLLLVHLNCAGRCDKGFIGTRLKHVARIWVIERDFLRFENG